jgi:hypothetical protein
MNKIYESPTMVVHDDREPLTAEQAFDILWGGHSVRINYPPDFSAENECDIYDNDYHVIITDIIGIDEIGKQSKDKSEKQVHEYLRGYEIYR